MKNQNTSKTIDQPAITKQQMNKKKKPQNEINAQKNRDLHEFIVHVTTNNLTITFI